MDTAAKIDEIVNARNNNVEPLIKEEEKCRAVQTVLDQLKLDLSRLAGKLDENEPLSREVTRLQADIPRLGQQINELREMINHCRRRFDRHTINIGFGGKRGQGKSFLLQKISGLSDNEVPSGSRKTVTAVRSEIFNNPEAYAEITFYSPTEFLNEVIRKYCEELKITPPTTLEEFAGLNLPDRNDVDVSQVAYLGRLASLQKHLPEYAPLLKSDAIIERDFNKLRKYVAYTDQNNNDIYTYAAVKRALIYTPFPETQVKKLGLVDLPGLGELNPTVETRHTSGFGDEVDVILLVRRPYGTRVDWGEEDQKAFNTLTGAVKDGSASDFVVIVQNEGGCDPSVAETALKCIREAVKEKFIVMRSTGDNSSVLSGEVLAPVLDHLARTLPEKDKRTLDEITGKARNVWGKLTNSVQKTLNNLKKSHDRGRPGEEKQQQGQESLANLARKLEDAAKLLDEKTRDQVENEELINEIEKIQQSLKNFLATGLGAGSIEEWIRINANKIAETKSPQAIYPYNANILRVQIAEEFTRLNHVYSDIIEDLLDIVAARLDEVLPNFLQGTTGREKLSRFRERLLNNEYSYDNIVEALDFLLNFKIEHRTQIYPRAYEPIREFMASVENPATIPDISNKSREEQAAAVFDHISGLARRVIMDVGELLMQESLYINKILFVALQFFDDKIIRSINAEPHWVRFISTFYPEIYGTRDDASKSAAILAVMDRLSQLNKTLQQGVNSERV